MAIRKSSNTGIPFGNSSARPSSPATGQPYFNGEVGRLELYTDNGWENIVQEVPAVSSISGSYNESEATGTFHLYGTNFVDGATAYAVGTNAVEYQASSVSFVSLVELSATFDNLPNAYEPYDIKVINPSNLFGLLPEALFVNASPVWTTSSGSLGTFEEQVAVSVSAVGTDSDSTITYSVTSGSLPSGLSLNSSTGAITGTLPNVTLDTVYNFTISASDGSNIIPRSFSISSVANLAPVWTTGSGSIATIYDSLRSSASVSLSSTDSENNSLTYALVSGSVPAGMTFNSNGTITGTPNAVSTDTTSTFVASVADRINTVERTFSITIKAPIVTTFSTVGSASWTAPSGISKIQLLMVGAGGGGGNNRGNGSGGGGGGGGIVYHPSATVTPGSTYSLSIGAGGGGGVANNQSGGPGCVTTGFGATVGGGGGGVSEYNGNCNQGSTCSYLPSTSVSGVTSGATITYNGGSGGCNYGNSGSGSTYTSSISGSSYTYGGINQGPTVYGSGGVISNSNGGSGVIIISY